MPILDVISTGNDTMNNSPRVRQQGVVPSAIRTGEVADNSITSAKIKSITWNKAQGGTLTLGGTNNTNGLEKVKDSSGNTIVQLDNTGIAVTNGKISVQNNNSSTIIDSLGIRSTNVFSAVNAFNGAAGLSTASTSFVDIAGSTLTTFVLTRTTYVLFYIMAYGQNSSAITSNLADNVEVSLVDSVDGASITNLIFYGATSTNTPDGISFNMSTANQMYARTSIVTRSAASHTVKLQYRAVGGGTALIAAWEVGYMILGS